MHGDIDLLFSVWRVFLFTAACFLVLYVEETSGRCRACDHSFEERVGFYFAVSVVVTGIVFALSDPWAAVTAIAAPVLVWMFHGVFHGRD